MTVQDQVRTRPWQQVAQAAWIGAALQAVCVALPLLDLWTFGSIERNVQGAYPRWDAAEVATDRNAIVGYLVAVGILGVLCGLGTVWAARRGRGVRATVTTLFTIGMLTLLTNATLGGEAYDRIVPLWLGLTLLAVPALPGLTALLAAWRGPAASRG